MTTVLESLNGALHSALKTDQRVIVLGEDILDPYGGAFKVTRGLSSQFPERVITTPISEAALIGIANGMAMRGLRPVVEIMFGDFITLVADQLINHAAKFRWMYNENVKVPMVLRAPMGGRRGYGPTHSQSLEKLFLGVPGMKVVAPNTLTDPGRLLQASIEDEDPVLFIENKILYTRNLRQAGMDELIDYQVTASSGPFPVNVLTPIEKPTITIATYGYNLELVLAAATEMMVENEVFPEIIVFSQLSPFLLDPLEDALQKTSRLLTVEEGGMTMGWGAEVIARMVERTHGSSSRIFRRVAAHDLPIANAKSLEDSILPSIQDIVSTSLDLVAQPV